MVVEGNNSSFPDQVVPDEEKATLDYGYQVGRAIEGEWFNYSGGVRNNRYLNNYNNFHDLRLYARGEQSIQKYKDELSINGDLSYLNLDWKPVPVLSKFIDIVVNGMSDRVYDVKAYAQDPASQKARTAYAESIFRDIRTREYLDAVKASLGIDMSNSNNLEQVPESEQELSIHMQLDYKQSIEIAEEELINNTLDRNKFDLVKKRFERDLAVIGIGATKTSFNRSEGITVEYVDPANMVYSYTEDPNFEDIWYVGEVKSLSLAEIKKQFPYLTSEELKEIQQYTTSQDYLRNWNGGRNSGMIQLLYFEYKTYANQVFKIKQTPTGLEKAIEKTDTFNPPESDMFDKTFRSIEVLYSGVKILGHNKMLQWQIADNMVRPKSNLVKVNMNYVLCAPRMYRGRIESLVSRTTGFADMIQLTHLKLQQVLSRLVPDGVYLDADGLAEVDLGNGTNYNPAEALNMYFQTGSIVGRSMTQDGDINPGKVPIQQLNTSSGMQKVQSLIQTYQYYLQMIRDVTGLNEARDGTTPDKNSLVGLQKMAAANSNTATRHILKASMYLTSRVCENISLRVSDCIEFDLTREALINSISSYNVGTLEELMNIHLCDFGIFLELEPDEEEKALLEQNIQMALQQQQIFLEDAIDIREVKNLKLANQLLKLKRKEKQAQDQQAQQANIEAQSQANIQTAEATALAETQKQQVLTEQQIQIEKAKNQFEISKLREEAEIKKELMQQEFEYNMQLAMAKGRESLAKDKYNNDRKDTRSKQEATQQSEIASQRQNDSAPLNFESTNNDILGGIDLGQFNPK
jgi:hypothetical protein